MLWAIMQTLTSHKLTKEQADELVLWVRCEIFDGLLAHSMSELSVDYPTLYAYDFICGTLLSQSLAAGSKYPDNSPKAAKAFNLAQEKINKKVAVHLRKTIPFPWDKEPK